MTESADGRLLERIAAAGSIEELGALRREMRSEMAAMLPSAETRAFYARLNATHDALIGRVIELAEEAAARSGKGSPPVPYAYLLFGSGGRMEQTLASDQDSGLIYADPPTDEERLRAADYFRSLAERIVGSLEALGYPLCEGRVISTDERWTGSLTEWRARLDEWFGKAEWELVRQLLIVTDARAVYGDSMLLEAVKDHFRTDMLQKPVIVRRMLDNTMRHKVLIGVFGQLLKERYGADAGGLDIKYGAYIPMVNAFRMMAVQEGLRATSTLERIAGLEEAGLLHPTDALAYRDAFLLILELRLLTTERGEGELLESSGKLPASLLTKEMAARIKAALRTGRKLQRRISSQTLSELQQGGE